MLPTIDVGSIAAIGGLAAVIKSIWAFICNSSTWLKNQFVIIVSSSRIWATAFFLGIVLLILGFVNALFSRATSLIATWVFSESLNLGQFSFEFGVIDQFFDFTSFFQIVIWCISFTFSVVSVQKFAGLINKIIQKFGLFIGAWKT